MKKSLFFTFFVLVSIFTQAAYQVGYKITPQGRFPISATHRPFALKAGEEKILRSIPYYWEEGAPLKKIRYEEVLINDEKASMAVVSLANTQFTAPNNNEVRTIVGDGPIQNRIHLTILGDGYTLAEKEKFFEDAIRITKDLFEGETFKSYLGLFQVHAIFVPSQESGLGDGKPKNTAFKLYRDPPGSKRAILPGDEGALERAIKLAPKTDYPIVIANDDYYGGLGGRYAISTRSERSGMIVLRHELGHNFGEVGEEYDAGYVYSGANASSSPQGSWSQWAEGKIETHEAQWLTGQYAWKNLAAGSYKAQFNANVKPTDWIFGTISSVGWDTENDVEITLNGRKLNFPGPFHEDRNFHEINREQNFPTGAYNFEAKELVHDGNNVLAFANIYSAPENYNFTPNTIGAFATYDANKRKTYRPTHDSCLMRNMSLKNFCSVDYENMWLKFLARMKLIDSVVKEASTDGTNTYRVFTPNIENLQISWKTKSGKVLIPKNSGHVLVIQDPKEPVIVEVELLSPEIRKKSKETKDTAEII